MEAMKHLFLGLLALLPVSLAAAPPLKIELIVPGEKVSLKKDAFSNAAVLAAASKRFDALTSNLTLAVRREAAAVEAQLMKGLELKQGLSLKLRFTNTSDQDFTFHYGPDMSTNHLTVTGPVAINLPYTGGMTGEHRMPDPTTIKAGATKDFVIEELRYGARNMNRWLIGKPGKYSISLRFVALIDDEKVDLKAEKVTVEIE